MVANELGPSLLTHEAGKRQELSGCVPVPWPDVYFMTTMAGTSIDIEPDDQRINKVLVRLIRAFPMPVGMNRKQAGHDPTPTPKALCVMSTAVCAMTGNEHYRMFLTHAGMGRPF